MMNDVRARTLRWQRVIVTIAAVGAGLVFRRSEGDIFGVPKATLVVLCAIACLAIGLGRAIRERELVLPRVWCVVAAAGFVAALVVTTITSTTPLQSVVGEYSQYAGLIGYASAVVLFFTVVRAFDERTLPTLVLSLVGGAAVITAYGLLQWAGADPFDLSGPHQIVATMGNTNFLAGWIGIVFPLCAAVALAPLPTPWRVVGGATAVAIVPLAVATESFQGPATVGIAAVVLVALLLASGGLRVPAPLRGRRGVIALVALVVIASPVVVKVLGDGLDQGLLERRHFWHVAVEVFEDHPVVGAGPDTFHNQYLSRRPAAHAAIIDSKNAGAAHDVPLDLLAGGGILVGGTYLAFVGLVGWRLVVAIRRRAAAPWLVAGIGAAWVAYLVQSLVSIDKPSLLVLHWVLAGAVVVLSGPVPARLVRLPGYSERRAPTAPLGSVIGIALVSILALAAGWVATRPFRADLAISAGRLDIKHKNGDAAERDIQRARDLAPWEATYTYDQVRLYSLANVPDKALAAAEEGVRLEPGDTSYDLVAGQIADVIGKHDRATAIFDRALEKDPYGISVLLGALSSASKAGERARAEHLVERVLAVSEVRADVWTGVGDARHALGDDAAARTAYRKALALQPGDPAAEKGLAGLGK